MCYTIIEKSYIIHRFFKATDNPFICIVKILRQGKGRFACYS